MTNSAKQDPKAGPAEAAETAQTESAAEAAKAENSATPAADDTAGDEAKPDIDDVKAKFREALDRKRQHHDEGQGKGGHESGKVSGAHGPAASRRSFRRKSG
jgi:hypothetical protein